MTENQEEFRQEMLTEDKMREDLYFALDKLGISDTLQTLQSQLKNLSMLGHQLTLKELLDEI